MRITPTWSLLPRNPTAELEFWPVPLTRTSAWAGAVASKGAATTAASSAMRSRRDVLRGCRAAGVGSGGRHCPAAVSRGRCGPDVEYRLSALGSRLSALGSRLSALGSRLSALGSRLSALGSRLSALGSRLSALGSRLSALGSRLSALGSRLSALGSRLSALGSLIYCRATEQEGVAVGRGRTDRRAARCRAESGHDGECAGQRDVVVEYRRSRTPSCYMPLRAPTRIPQFVCPRHAEVDSRTLRRSFPLPRGPTRRRGIRPPRRVHCRAGTGTGGARQPPRFRRPAHPARRRRGAATAGSRAPARPPGGRPGTCRPA